MKRDSTPRWLKLKTLRASHHISGKYWTFPPRTFSISKQQGNFLLGIFYPFPSSIPDLHDVTWGEVTWCDVKWTELKWSEEREETRVWHEASSPPTESWAHCSRIFPSDCLHFFLIRWFVDCNEGQRSISYGYYSNCSRHTSLDMEPPPTI